jgi:hypothetical protein
VSAGTPGATVTLSGSDTQSSLRRDTSEGSLRSTPEASRWSRVAQALVLPRRFQETASVRCFADTSPHSGLCGRPAQRDSGVSLVPQGRPAAIEALYLDFRAVVCRQAGAPPATSRFQKRFLRGAPRMRLSTRQAACGAARRVRPGHRRAPEACGVGAGRAPREGRGALQPDRPVVPGAGYGTGRLGDAGTRRRGCSFFGEGMIGGLLPYSPNPGRISRDVRRTAALVRQTRIQQNADLF